MADDNAGEAADGDGDRRETREMRGLESNPAALFQSIELFQGLTPEEMREILQAAEDMELGAGDILFEQGEPAEALYVVASGNLRVSARSPMGEEIVLAEIDRGSVVGEMSIISGGERSATVEAVENCRLFRISRPAFETLRGQNRPAAYKLIMRLARMLGDRRRRTDDRIQEVFEDPERHLDEFEEHVHEMIGQIRKV